MTDSADTPNPFAPPVAKVEDMQPAAGELAGRGARLVASFLDGAAFMLLLALVGLVTGFKFWDPESLLSGSGLITSYLTTIAAFLGLQGWLLHLSGQTVGKLAMSIRIVRRDGARAGVARLLGLRLIPMWFVGLIPLLGPLISLVDSLLIFRDSRRCLHDDIADTIVVRA